MRLDDLPKVLVGECRIKTQAASFQIPELNLHILWNQPESYAHSPLNNQINSGCWFRSALLLREDSSYCSISGPERTLSFVNSTVSSFSIFLRLWGRLEKLHVWKRSHLMLFLVSSIPWLCLLVWEFQASPLFSSFNGVYWTLSQCPFCPCFFLQTPSLCIWSFLSFISAGRRGLYATVFLPR